MLKSERQQKILDIVNENSYVSVNKLSKILYASLPTIRRDLSELEAKGVIKRNHGGAVHITEGSVLLPLEFRSRHDTHEKIEMCKKAAKLISNGDVIYIDASTSTMYIADFISAKDVTVITNGMPIATLLAKKGIKTYFTGGEVSPNSMGCSGKFAEAIASSFNYNLAFFSAYGVNEREVIVDPSLPEILLRKEVFKNCEKTVFLYVKSKENLTAPYNLAHLSDIDIVITNE